VPGNGFPVFETDHGKVGLAMCSEVYMPEVARALALRGAELIFMPAGRDKRRLWATWRTLIWARAIENLAIVVTTQNLPIIPSAAWPWWQRPRRFCSRARARA
jgi:5-aminopentanamidase